MSEYMSEQRYADLIRLPADSFRGIELELLREIGRLRAMFAELHRDYSMLREIANEASGSVDRALQLAEQLDEDELGIYSHIGDMIRAVITEDDG